MALFAFSLASVHISPVRYAIAEMKECALEILLWGKAVRVRKSRHNRAGDRVIDNELVESHSGRCLGNEVYRAGETAFLRVLNLPSCFLRLSGPNECRGIAVHSFDLEKKSSQKRLDRHRSNDYRKAIVSAFQLCLTAVQEPLCCDAHA